MHVQVSLRADSHLTPDERKQYQEALEKERAAEKRSGPP
jgi:hypothetical protein